jgi:hypothetical protein
MRRIDEILKTLKDVNLLTEKTLVMIKGEAGKEIFNFCGERVESHLFDRINTPFALFTFGKYSSEYCKMGKAIVAANDDAALMFGHKVKYLKDKNPKTNGLIFNEGFVVVGRFPNEITAAAILLEKMCKVEMLAGKIGKVKHLNPFLATLEHFVYKRNYSKKEKVRYDQGR